MSEVIRILLVGHCLPDRYLLSRVVKKAAPTAEIESVNTDEALQKHLGAAHLLLVNRVLDGRFELSSGIELIRALVESGEERVAMLISNYEDAQREAEAVGAVPGFGKSELGRETTIERIQMAIGLDTSSTDAS